MTQFADIAARCDAIEACYEFMLAYAAQGIADDRESPSGSQLRELLSRAVDAAAGLSAAYAATVVALHLTPEQRYKDFLDVLDADTGKALAAMRLVLAQPRISSQLVDNLNASLHVRTLLTDVFLLDEVLPPHRTAQPAPPRPADRSVA
ncbi:conserved hypothetical protein [Solidesulfovibrio fructosivorans JJ]]|uniref:Uncharacterized protein n=1 Tax=Solidesulfovibrio fructosivorans JJ] TaxID=596151 RepID=E1JTQ0_SOLFR|nr:hypothetical protein [Solidesulfovibrio fructosivorans]EFL52179.1 conserved hypothetical protein [Solidesulfovibrio fructosivorans JJ]]